ncbi:MAG: Gfo/Idh/MocA family oxidoreductase, partial [Aliifodinibius sp.]|nr:Gfo/Idh/MocA family oxidoreductase [Fodinibius sp.]
QYPEIMGTLSYGDILRCSQVDAIVLATPAIEHFSMALRALQMGKDVFVEKPLALSVSDAEMLVKIAKNHKSAF